MEPEAEGGMTCAGPVEVDSDYLSTLFDMAASVDDESRAAPAACTASPALDGPMTASEANGFARQLAVELNLGNGLWGSELSNLVKAFVLLAVFRARGMRVTGPELASCAADVWGEGGPSVSATDKAFGALAFERPASRRCADIAKEALDAYSRFRSAASRETCKTLVREFADALARETGTEG